MSKLLINFALLNAKAIVNTYTVVTLPFYTLYQRPWRTLRLAKNFGVQTRIDNNGRTVYSRPAPAGLEHPYYQLETMVDVFPILDRSRKVIGLRDVIQETLELDENGKKFRTCKLCLHCFFCFGQVIQLSSRRKSWPRFN